jgi:GT2 family glycosyltransferase
VSASTPAPAPTAPPSPAPAPAAAPASVGIVVATRDRAPLLLSTLKRLRALPERPPVVVVDNGSRDGTPELVRRRAPWATVVALGENRGAAARTVGARALATDVVAFADDDSWWAPGALARVGALFAAHPRLGLLTARILVGPDERLDPTCAAMAASPLGRDDGGPGTRVLGFVACGTAVRRSAFLAAGGFHPRMAVGGEETLLALDLASRGWGLRYVREVVAHHHPEADGSRGDRHATVLRNRLWAAWLRRPARAAAAETVAALREARTRAVARGLRSAIAGLPWIARERRVVPPAVERDVRLLNGLRLAED